MTNRTARDRHICPDWCTVDHDQRVRDAEAQAIAAARARAIEDPVASSEFLRADIEELRTTHEAEIYASEKAWISLEAASGGSDPDLLTIDVYVNEIPHGMSPDVARELADALVRAADQLEAIQQ